MSPTRAVLQLRNLRRRTARRLRVPNADRGIDGPLLDCLLAQPPPIRHALDQELARRCRRRWQ